MRLERILGTDKANISFWPMDGAGENKEEIKCSDGFAGATVMSHDM